MTILQFHKDATIVPDPSRTIARPFFPGYPALHAGISRPQAIVARILALDDAAIAEELAGIATSLNDRHRDLDTLLMRRFDQVASDLDDVDAINDQRRRLIGAYFTTEYAFEGAALFNPSVVLHPEQDDVPEGTLRFVMSLRGVGEGHLSSVSFRTGLWTPGGPLAIDPPSPTTMPPIVHPMGKDGGATHIELHCGGSRVVSETVLFPVLPSQSGGIEDVRLVRFVDDDGGATYYGTYTAVSGGDGQSEMLVGTDFRDFEMRALMGDAADGKGMALFPRKIGGRYAMLGRQDGENVWLLYSDDLFTWNGGEKLLCPRYPWEFVAMGNCGSPMEIDEGWLVITHGIGRVRSYAMGAALLDRDDPSRVLARTPEPILEPQPEERDGYVPNVVYSCGAMVHGRDLLLPYAVADRITSFATAKVDDLLAAMEHM